MSTLINTKISIVTLSREGEGTCVPSKAFSALAAGSAILAVAPMSSDLARLVTREGAGRVVEPGDVRSLIDAWLELVSQPDRLAECRANARRAAAKFDMAVLARDWSALLDRVNDCDRPAGVGS
jgi:glycosyltransferase involved in cell wall biosynthesis